MEQMNDRELAQMILSRVFSIDFSTPEFDKLDLTLGQKKILQRLMVARQDGVMLAMTDLSVLMDTTKSSISQTVSKLERKGLVKRSWAKGDRRRILVNLTAKGSTHVENLHAGVLDFISEMLGRLEDKEKELIVGVFNKCTAGLDRYFKCLPQAERREIEE